MIALEMGFSECHFIDKNQRRVKALRELAVNKPNVHVYHGDCNTILVNEVFPQYTYKSYKRALCLLDPYELNPNWEVVSAAGAMRTIEIFLNFSIMDANMNVFKHNQDKVEESQIRRMNIFWGDDSWKKVAYNKVPTLFGDWRRKNVERSYSLGLQGKVKGCGRFQIRTRSHPYEEQYGRGNLLYFLCLAQRNRV